MGLRIKTNIASLNAQRRLMNTTKEMQGTMARLASGERINKSADDAAGLAVSENLRADVRSLMVAKRNANDGISLVQTAEGGLVETSNMLVRLRELAIQASSDTIGDRERQFLDKEFVQLKEEIDRVANSTEFNGTRLLVGSSEPPEGRENFANAFPLEIHVANEYYEIADGQEARNPINIIRIDFQNINSYTHGEGSLQLGEATDGTRVASKENAQQSLGVIDQALYRVNDYRAYLGAVQNRLDSAIRNLGVQTENLEQSRSRIRDTDYALETAELTKSNIMQQAGTSILAAANAQPQIALGLLSG